MSVASASAIEIVDFVPELAGEFRELNVEWLDKYFRVEPIDDEMLRHPEEIILAGGGTILFAKQGDTVVGTAALKHHGKGNYELTKMAVTERCQGGGIGRMLVLACISKYREIGGRRLYLESHSSLKPALCLYEAVGFERRPPPRPSEYQRADVYMVYRHG